MFIGLLVFIFINVRLLKSETIEIKNETPVHSQNENVGEPYTDGKINLNSAGENELDSLMYIGRDEAELIIEYRNKNGNFESLEDIKYVEGLSSIMRKVIIDNCYVE